MSDLRERLEERAAALPPDPDALDRIRAAAARRRLRRRGTAGAVAAILVGVLVFSGVLSPATPTPGDAAPPLSRPLPARDTSAVAVREQFGIVGPTKGSPAGVVVPAPRRPRTRRHLMSVVEMSSGKRVSVPRGTTVTVGPGGALATVGSTKLSVKRTGSASAVVVRTRTRARQVTWSADGTALFALVGSEWILVPTGSTARGSDANRAGQVTPLHVPRLPGGPTLMSVSPDGTHVLLFGIVTAPAVTPTNGRVPGFARAHPLARVPYLYLGDFDGTTVTAVRPIPIPATALSGPLGWLGDNAFLVAPGPGRALIVRPGQPPVEVRAMGIPASCVAGETACPGSGPWLLGTNQDGTLLLWRVHGLDAAPEGPAGAAYYATWLDGSHAARLTGVAARYGPAVAPR